MSKQQNADEGQLPDEGRRRFLNGAAALSAGLALAPGITLFTAGGASAAQGASSKVRWGLLIDTTQCTSGCSHCIDACVEENGLQGLGRPATDAQWVRKVELRDTRTGWSGSLPMMCQHCEHPPCVDVCPTGASFKRADGIVLVDKHICIGCRYCMMACPYKARSFIHEPVTDQKPDVPRGMGTVESCTMCVHKVDRGEQPACVQACATAGHGAIVFGDLNDPNSEIARRVAQYPARQIREDLNLNTGVRYLGV
jgi:tetrathionate reductase subunit B